VLLHSKDSVYIGLTGDKVSIDDGNTRNPYVLNRGENIHFFHKTGNFLPMLGFYDLTSNLSTVLTVHGEMNSRKAPASKAM
jgi:hypothetical protein